MGGTSFGGWAKKREGLDSVYTVNEFRIFYDKNGTHQLPAKYQIDHNNNNIPDYVEDIGRQLVSASYVFCDILGFVHPLQSKRYKTQNVQFIDVHILASKTGGGAGDGVRKLKYNSLDNDHKALSIALSNNLKSHSLTPMHEMFHLIQNGYTMFKTRWLTEGTSRWAESIFREGTGSTQRLPQSVQALDDSVLSQTYKTSYFWRRLAYLCDNEESSFKTPGSFTNEYIDGEKIIEDNTINGVNFLLTLLENLEIEDKKRSLYDKHDPFNWKEKEQKSSKNTPFILCALKQTIFQECENLTPELAGLLSVIDEYTQNKCYY